jgi:hypothetical protein
MPETWALNIEVRPISALLGVEGYVRFTRT